MNDNVSISLSLGSNISGQTAASSQPTHIVINVRGPLMPNDVIWNWDAHQGGNIVPPPANIVLDVPKGPDRLFQILVVNENGSGQMQFLYGDTVKTLAAAAEDVSISVANIGSGGEEAEIGGRYLTGDDVGPTGALELLFQPPGTNRPAMKIFNTSMINGWFQLFMINGAPFTYRWVHSGATLFSGNGFSDPEFTPASNLAYKLHLIRPAGYSYYQKDGGAFVTEARAAARMVAGYFGPAAPTYGKVVCYTPAQTMQSFYSDIGHTTAILYDPSSVATTKTIRLNNQGGIAYGSGACAGGDPFIDWIKVDGKYAGNGRDQTFGFRGIFASPANSNTISSSFNSGTQVMTLSWSFLPGVIGANGADGVAIYAHPNFEGGMEMGGDGIDCEKLQTVGFSWVGDTSSNSFAFPVTSTNQSTTKAALCPYKLNYAGKPRYLFNGTRYENHGSGGGGSPATKLTFYGPVQINAGACVPYILKGETATNNPGYLSTSASSSVTLATNLGNFHTDPSCGGSVSTINFSPYSTWQQVYLKYSGSPSSGVLGASFSGLTSASYNLDSFNAGVNDHFAIYSQFSATPGATFSMNKGTCQSVLLQVHDSNNRAVGISGSLSGITIADAPANGYVFTDGSCSSSFTSGAMSPTQTNLFFYVKVPFADAQSSITLTASAGGVTSSNITLTPTAPGPAVGLQIWGAESGTAGTCNPFKIVSVDSMSAPSPVSAATTIALTASSGTVFYPSGSCTGATTSTAISSGQAETTLYWKRMNAGNDVVGANATAGDSLGSKTINTTINAGSVAYTIFVLPGQTFNPGQTSLANAVTGAPSSGAYTATYGPISAYIVDSFYNIVTSASGSCSTIYTSDTYDTNPSGISFSSGVASFNLSTTNSGSGLMILGSSSSCSPAPPQDSSSYNRP